LIKTGDTVRDGRGRAFQIGQLLGRGLWGRTYAAREDGSSAEWVVKLPYTSEDLPSGEGGLADACREIFDEQLRILQSAPSAGMVEVETHFVLENGTPVIVLQRMASSLERRLHSGCGLEELLRTLLDVGLRLQSLSEYLPCHGNLKANNILLDDRGEVFLSDPMCPALKRALPGLMRAQEQSQPFTPPEVRHGSGSAPLGGGVDSYSLSMLLYRGTMAIPGENGLTEPDLPLEGLDKGRMVELKDTILNRLKKEHSNPRFHTRLSDRTAALLNRGLSRETSPSPPYRFRRMDEYLGRLEELQALVHPAVSYVGRMIIPQQALNEGYSTGEDVTFSCTVACTPGVESQDEIACGLAVFDTARDERLRDVACAYTVERHPSGRFRFSFRVSDLPPGAFRARTAFTLRESGDEPMTTEAEFQIRPSPGYVPPIREPESRPLELSFDRDSEPKSGPADVAPPPGATESNEGEKASTPGLTEVPLEHEQPREPDFPMPTPISPPVSETFRQAAPAEQLQAKPPEAPPSDSTDALHSAPAPEPTVEPADVRAEPEFSGTGRWSDLPLPATPKEDLPSRQKKKSPLRQRRSDVFEDDALEPGESAGPVGDFIGRIVQMIRGDQFVLFIGGTAIAIILLALVLLFLKS
jgi:serine/threonine protein kinase